MLLPDVTPEHGVTRYQGNPPQGPACATAAGATTICRNHLVPVDAGVGQTADRRLDGLAELGTALRKATGRPVGDVRAMRSGCALRTRAGLDAIATHLASAGEETVDALRGRLRIGMHRDAEVTDGDGSDRLVVSQAFCSALLVAYGQVSAVHWKAFAALVLEAAYEATPLAAVKNAQRGGSNVVALTRLGGEPRAPDRRSAGEASR